MNAHGLFGNGVGFYLQIVSTKDMKTLNSIVELTDKKIKASKKRLKD
jgi:hypothetical protein